MLFFLFNKLLLYIYKKLHYLLMCCCYCPRWSLSFQSGYLSFTCFFFSYILRLRGLSAGMNWFVRSATLPYPSPFFVFGLFKKLPNLEIASSSYFYLQKKERKIGLERSSPLNVLNCRPPEQQTTMPCYSWLKKFLV